MTDSIDNTQINGKRDSRGHDTVMALVEAVAEMKTDMKAQAKEITEIKIEAAKHTVTLDGIKDDIGRFAESQATLLEHLLSAQTEKRSSANKVQLKILGLIGSILATGGGIAMWYITGSTDHLDGAVTPLIEFAADAVDDAPDTPPTSAPAPTPEDQPAVTP